ncbi:MAG: hypothetical protein ACRDNZ_24040 [Streptosporangiaceae bacterium]
MSAEAYSQAVGELLPVIDRGLTDADRFAVLAFAVVQNPAAVRSALEAYRDSQAEEIRGMSISTGGVLADLRLLAAAAARRCLWRA